MIPGVEYDSQDGMIQFLMQLLGGGQSIPLNQGGDGGGWNPGVPYMGEENLNPFSAASSAGAQPARQGPMVGFNSPGMSGLPQAKKNPFYAPKPRNVMVNDPELDAILASVGGAKLL